MKFLFLVIVIVVSSCEMKNNHTSNQKKIKCMHLKDSAIKVFNVEKDMKRSLSLIDEAIKCDLESEEYRKIKGLILMECDSVSSIRYLIENCDIYKRSEYLYLLTDLYRKYGDINKSDSLKTLSLNCFYDDFNKNMNEENLINYVLVLKHYGNVDSSVSFLNKYKSSLKNPNMYPYLLKYLGENDDFGTIDLVF